VRHVALRAAEVLFLPTAALVAVLVLAPGRAELAVHVYVLVLLAAALASIVAAIASSQAEAGASIFDAALRHEPAKNERLQELMRLEREAALAQSSAFDLHYRLRPVLREIASGLLAARRGIELDRRPERAREVLGEETFDLVRPDREAPWDRLAPGIDVDELRAVVTRLEAI
jgi:hypothetical protein